MNLVLLLPRQRLRRARASTDNVAWLSGLYITFLLVYPLSYLHSEKYIYVLYWFGLGILHGRPALLRFEFVTTCFDLIEQGIHGVFRDLGGWIQKMGFLCISWVSMTRTMRLCRYKAYFTQPAH